MADFTSGFWEWFIILVTAVSLVAIGLFALLSARGKKTAGAKPETMGHVWDQDLTEYNNPLPRWWLNLFYLTLIFGALYLMLYPGLGGFAGLLGWTQAGQYEEEMAEAERVYGPLYQKYLDQDLKAVGADPQGLKMGKRLFANYCATCHGADAGGALGFPKGRQGRMPAHAEFLGEAKAHLLAAYVYSLSAPRSLDRP